MLQIPIAAYPLIGAGTGLLMAASAKISGGKNIEFVYAITGGTLLGVAYAALTLIGATYGALAGAVACIACTAVLVVVRGLITKEIRDINNLAFNLILGTFVGGSVAYYGFPLLAGCAIAVIVAPAINYFKPEAENRVRG